MRKGCLRPPGSSPLLFAQQRAVRGYTAPEQRSVYAPVQTRGLGYINGDVPVNYGGVLGATTVWDTKIVEISSAIDSLFADLHSQEGLDNPGLVRSYIAFAGEWHAWVAAHDSSFERGVDFLNMRGALLGFIRRYNAFEGQARRAGVRLSNPGDPEPPAGGLPTWGWALIAIGGVAVGGYALWGIARVLSEGRQIASGS